MPRWTKKLQEQQMIELWYLFKNIYPKKKKHTVNFKYEWHSHLILQLINTEKVPTHYSWESQFFILLKETSLTVSN